MKKIIIVGSGFSSLAASCYLAKAGLDVTIVEKNETSGGRASQLKKNGFTFDMGPTFYWMPDVFEDFFSDFGKQVHEFYQLEKLGPAYRVYFNPNDYIDISDNFEEICNTFERIETGAGKKLKNFISLAESNYNVAIKDLVYQPGNSIFELVQWKTILKLDQFFSTIKSQVRKQFKHPYLVKILEFPVLFLGAKPSNTPGFYNFMNYADFVLGTWHPKGGFFEVAQGMTELAKSLGVKFEFNQNVQQITVDSNNRATGLITDNKTFNADIVLSGADYAFTESILPTKYRQYSDNYWDKKTFAPSALLFYVGFDKKIEGVEHHTLFFDSDFEVHAKAIYDDKNWPDDPLFYASFPSKTDAQMAPEGKENGIFLIPLAPGLDDTEDIKNKYFEIVMDRLEKSTNASLRNHVEFYEAFGVNDFKNRYNSYKGNAYGLANTLLQTHVLRPNVKSKKMDNLYYTGQLTVPGPGVPPSLISGKIVADEIIKNELKQS